MCIRDSTWGAVSAEAEVSKAVYNILSFIFFNSLKYMRMMSTHKISTKVNEMCIRDRFYPERMASRILGMGDVMSLIEKAEAAVDQEAAQEMSKKLKKMDFDFNDYLTSLEQMNKMGGDGYKRQEYQPSGRT